tara:strand:- start:149 stop:361 length:213 start_codon:yes stop_codon:yes gene_type:complete
MTTIEQLEELVRNIDTIEPFGIEPDFSSLGIEPAEVLGFRSEDELEKAIYPLTMDIYVGNQTIANKYDLE